MQQRRRVCLPRTSLVLAVVVLLICPVYGVSAAPLLVPGSGGTTLDARPDTEPDPVQLDRVAAAFAVDLTNGVELFSQAADLPLPPASTTKIVTALVASEHAALDDLVTIQAADQVDPTIYSHVGLLPGDVVSVRDLLAGLLIPSGGDAALALAHHVGAELPGDADSDPSARFVAEMNRRASELGMRRTTFRNPDGRDDPGQVTTARDLAIATQALMSHPVLEQLVGTPSLTVHIAGPNARRLTLWNTNGLLGSPGVHGVKTGTSDEAGQNLVTAVWRGDARIVLVVLGGDDRYRATWDLLNILDERFRWVRLGAHGDLPMLQAELDASGLVFLSARTVLLSAEQAADLSYDITLEQTARTSEWQARGAVEFMVRDVPLATLALYDRGAGAT